MGAMAKEKAGFRFNKQEQPVLESGGASLTKKPHCDTKPCSGLGGRKSAGGNVQVLLTLERRGARGQCSRCITVYDFITIIFICCTGWYNSQIFGAMEKHHFQ